MLTFKEKMLCQILGRLKWNRETNEFIKCKWNDILIWIARTIEPDFSKVMALIDKLTVGDEVRIPIK